MIKPKMTPKQKERIQKKIKQIRAALAAEKRKFGAYDDSRGLRYMPPKLYLQLQDYKGGLTYFHWFKKNFPDDIGFPDFLFEWTIILFKTGKRKDAEKKALETYFSNIYIFDKFFGRPIIPVNKYEFSNTETHEFLEGFEYSVEQPELKNFSIWLDEFIQIDYFLQKSKHFIDLNKRLLREDDNEKRRFLLQQIEHLIYRK